MKIDLIDTKILFYLEENAKLSNTYIGKKLGISETAVRKRIKKLEEKKVIINYKANINYKKLGFSNKVIIGIDTNSKDYFIVLNKLKTLDFITSLNTSSGDHMIIFEVWIKNLDELNNYLEQINSIGGVIQSCPSIIHEKYTI